MSLLRSLPFSIGVVLLVVAAGNIIVGTDKVEQYEDLLRERGMQVAASQAAVVTRLTPQQAATLLQPLRHGSGADIGAAGKLAFYKVVATGGWCLAAAGILFGLFGIVQHRRRSTSVRNPDRADPQPA